MLLSRSEIYQRKTYLECSVDGPKVCSKSNNELRSVVEASEVQPRYRASAYSVRPFLVW